jgi:hypothetical protein
MLAPAAVPSKPPSGILRRAHLPNAVGDASLGPLFGKASWTDAQRMDRHTSKTSVVPTEVEVNLAVHMAPICVLPASRLKPADQGNEEITEIAKLPPAKAGGKGWSAEADPGGGVIVFAGLD